MFFAWIGGRVINRERDRLRRSGCYNFYRGQCPQANGIDSNIQGLDATRRTNCRQARQPESCSRRNTDYPDMSDTKNHIGKELDLHLVGITLLDTAIASTNLGDQIIMEAVRHELSDIISESFCYSVATHERMGRKSRSLIDRSQLTIAGGTNLLSSRMWWNSVWKLSPWDALKNRNVLLMGVGWYQFQKKPDLYSQWLLRRILSRDDLHSVRDSFTEQMLASIGITNVVNTACPTLWALSADRCHAIPKQKAECVVTTLNTYMPDSRADAMLLRTLRQHYRTIYF